MDIINHLDSFNMRNMRNSYSLFFVFFAVTSLLAQQKGSVKEANELFKKKSFVKASKIYEEAEPSREVLQNLGDCYYYNFKMTEAAKAYGQLFSQYSDSIQKEVFFRYANALKGTKDFEKGDLIMSEYLGSEQNTLKFMKNVTRNNLFTYTMAAQPMSNTEGDFGISFYGDKVTFASTKNAKGEPASWNNKPFYDLFYAGVNEQGELVDILPFESTINSKNHESSASFSADGKVMYFNRTSNKMITIGDETFANIKIFKAEFDGKKWTNVTPLPFCSDQYSVEHPFLTKDGKKLYFSSDMEGTLGSFDLYVVDVNPDGTYGKPKNLGDAINTIHREQFPFIGDDGSLYFASDGHIGYGNLDLYKCLKIDEDTFDEPMNLGLSINSEMDDFNFIVDEASQKGYFTSNRAGDDNLYTFARQKNNLQFLVEGEVRDKVSLEILPGTKIKLFDEEDNLLEEIVVGKDGTFMFNTKPNNSYKVMAFKDFYIPAEAKFETSEKGKVYIDLQMKVESYYDAEDIINKQDDGSVLIELENIYFDLDKWDIKPQAEKVLNVLVDMLLKYPYMEIQIGSHTDSRGSASYNLELSHKRAASAKEYLIKNGIEKERLSSVGYGESKPLIVCPNDDCTETEHAANRRCTFMIVK